MATSKIKAKYPLAEIVNITIPSTSPILNPSTVTCVKRGDIVCLTFYGTQFDDVPIGTTIDNIITGLPLPTQRCVFNLLRSSNEALNVPLVLQIDGRITQNSNNGITNNYYNGTLTYICRN